MHGGVKHKSHSENCPNFWYCILAFDSRVVLRPWEMRVSEIENTVVHADVSTGSTRPFSDLIRSRLGGQCDNDVEKVAQMLWHQWNFRELCLSVNKEYLRTNLHLLSSWRDFFLVGRLMGHIRMVHPSVDVFLSYKFYSIVLLSRDPCKRGGIHTFCFVEFPNQNICISQ